MTTESFPGIATIPFQGPGAESPLAFRHYDPDRVVLGRRMEDQLRFAVCYWHGFAWGGADTFGDGTFQRPWLAPGDPMVRARQRTDAVLELLTKLGVQYFTFHDRDLAPEGETLRESSARLAAMADHLGAGMQRTGKKLLWGTANLFGHPRYAAGAATSPDPAVFACAAAQVRQALEVTHTLGGENYVLWGGREGYDTLLNTDLRRELDQLGRFLSLVVDHKHRIGFRGTLLIEPKPMEPTKHQYDFDAATVHAFLRRYGLERELKLNLEVNHATLAGHSFAHEVTYAIANDLFGSVDANRGDPQLGWDTDQFPADLEDMTLALHAILEAGGIGRGGFNFDAKLRRQSIDDEDLFLAHIGGMDTLALALLRAAALIEQRTLTDARTSRYADWEGPLGRSILAGEADLASLADRALDENLSPRPRSGKQELLENRLGRVLYG